MTPRERALAALARCQHGGSRACASCIADAICYAVENIRAEEMEECCKVICGRCARGWPLVDGVHEHPTEPRNENVVLVCFAAELREQRGRART